MCTYTLPLLGTIHYQKAEKMKKGAQSAHILNSLWDLVESRVKRPIVLLSRCGIVLDFAWFLQFLCQLLSCKCVCGTYGKKEMSGAK